ncbi:MAG: potassium channel family protein [Rhodovarius sp.]|nr:potassium channel family protein [Rhodovarius sp.]
MMERRSSARHAAFSSWGLTLGLLLLVAIAVDEQDFSFTFAALVVSGLALGGLYLVFPQGLMFALGVATGLSAYMCLYVVIGRSAFPEAEAWAQPVGFTLPVVGFVLACWLRRTALRRLAQEAPDDRDLAHLPRFGRWLLLCTAVAATAMASPISRTDPLTQTLSLLVLQSLLGAISAWFVRDVVRLMVDIAGILALVSAQMRFLTVPIAAYLALFSLASVAFGCIYHIADEFSRTPLFEKGGAASHITFTDALHLSVMTLSTVGYGDVTPQDSGIRILAAVQAIIGQLLLLFGFAEIMRLGRRSHG